jgi:asparagine N-glycosylation enzyme membrane subunit Stt3
MERDYRKRIASLREKISELGADIKAIRDHQKEEQSLMEKHKDELALLDTAGSEEKRKIMESHAEQERQLFESHEAEEQQLIESTSGATKATGSRINIVWIALLAIMIIAFATRMLSIGIAPKYFEFDPYYDMISTQYILTYGFQPLTEHAAWPTLINGTIHRIQPLVPYLEAYWYNLAGGNPANSAINTTLLSNVSSWYPPITAALLVFIVFLFLYHEYGEFEAIIGAGLAAVMPVLLTTFIAGEQLLEPWGIFALVFFYAAYLLAANNPDELRFAVLAGIAFASNFLGAHYYTVPAGILSMYIVLQGIVHVIRNEKTRDFYRMNIVMLGIVVLF